MKILVLGAGRMGFGAVYDLAHNSTVEAITVADLNIDAARRVAEKCASSRVTPRQINVTNYEETVDLLRGHDAAISCVTYFHNEQLARAAIEARVNFCDLGGNNTIVERELALDEE